ncbi:COQ9 family protein [Parvularcula dongshanensis]|uniref:Ubiquinone biosynthesis protein COQ9 n=1 Tax=Parvularcula dongshanensis TaxID=1173995 RepID=A0A840I0W2_9PROT|nr:COQ9 family protein [Parvularcula dongshanensis]MBB4657911.1 ubiquinone biosynthesis protein COQ9 [Parvularcula dongshanensis]
MTEQAADAPLRDPLDDVRDRVLDEALAEAAFDGWTRRTLDRALGQADVRPQDRPFLFPEGVRDLLDYWAQREDARMLTGFGALAEAPRGVTAKIRWLVRTRIEGLAPDKEAARRAAATLALPPYIETGAKLTWRTADEMWRAAGDTATDFNHYTKRATLSAVYAATAARFFSDEGGAADDPYAATWAFLDARLVDVMRFEKAKARAAGLAPDPAAIAAMLGRLRYGRR